MPIKVADGDKGTVRIESAVSGKDDGRIVVVLTGIKTAYGDKTKVRVEGKHRADPPVQQILSDVELSLAKKTNT